MRIYQRRLLINSSNKNVLFHRGYTLIEILISISVFIIISSLAIRNFVLGSADFHEEIKNSRQDFYVNEAFRYIEKEMNDKVKSIDISNDSIILERLDCVKPGSKLVDYIMRAGNNVVIEYFENEFSNSNATNIILRNVEEFTARKDGCLIFVNIKFADGKRFERCIGSQNIKH